MGSARSEVKERDGSILRFSEPIWQCIIVAGVALFIEIIIRRTPGWLGIAGGPDPYWALSWARDYSNGFERRALLGSMQRIFYIDPSDYRIITMFSWASSLALYVTVIAAILNIVDEIQTPIRLALVAIVLISPATTGLIVETTGDPLQLLLAVYFILIYFVFGSWREPMSNTVTVAIIFSGFAIASILAHEASIFFTLPCTLIIAFWRKTKPAFAALISHSLSAGLTVAFVIWATERSGAPSTTPLLHIGAESIAPDAPEYWGSFSSLLAQQMSRLFGQGTRGLYEWITILTSSLLLPIFLIYLLMLARGFSDVSNKSRVAVLLLIMAAAPASLSSDIAIRSIGYLACFGLFPAFLIFTVTANYLMDKDKTSDSGCSGLLPIFAALVLFSAPLYIMGQDWGRFLSYSLFSSIILYSMSPETSKFKMTSLSFFGISSLIGAGLLSAGLTSTPLLQAYRYRGFVDVKPIFIVLSVTIVVALLLKELWSVPRSPIEKQDGA